MAAVLVACAVSWPALAQQKVNAGSQLQQEFDRLAAEYLKLRKDVKPPALKPTDSPERITHHQREFAERIRKARPEAFQGAIFTPAIAAEFRRLIGMAMQGTDADRIRTSMQRAEPVRSRALRVNREYPRDVPLQSTPPSLLLNLPPLPPELDYRIVGRALVLRDTGANFVVDFLPNAIP